MKNKKIIALFFMSLFTINFQAFAKSNDEPKISKGKVVINLKNHHQQIVLDKPSCPCYTYKKYLKNVGYYTFNVIEEGSEGLSAMLVNDKTGKEFKVDAIPLVSPNNKKFVTTSMDLSAGFDPNKIEVWHFAKKGMVRDFSLTLEKWGPSDPIWLNNNTISFSKNIFETKSGNIIKTAKLFLKFNGKKWALTDKK